MFNHSYKDYYSFFPESSKIKATSWRGETFLKNSITSGERECISERFGTWREKKARTCDVISFKNTDVLLLDEPTAGISVEEVPAILQVIENIKKHPESYNCTY